VAIGGMLMSAAYTLFRMRKSLIGGIGRSINDVKKAASSQQATLRTDKDINIKIVFSALLGMAVITFIVYWWFMGFSQANLVPALAAALVMLVAGFFFAAVSGYLVGLIGSSNNPISGLTLSTLVIAAILMVILGAKGIPGVTAVLAVAGVICVAAAVAGEMLQDLKVGHILGGTPWKMQVGDLIGVIVASLVMWIPLFILNAGDLKMAALKGYKGGFGGEVLAAPQAGLMAKLSQGIVGGEMVWPLIVVGILMAVGFILVQVKSPMLVCVGMYLSFETVAAIFVGGIIRWVVDMMIARRKYNDNQKSRIENRGVLLASRNSAHFLENGKEIHIEGKDLFLNYRIEDIPGLGKFELYPNRDSVPYKELYGLKDAETVMRGTYRFPGWCDTLKKMVDLGMMNDSPSPKLKGASYKEMMAQLVDEDSKETNPDPIREKIAAKVSISVDSDIMKRLEWLGLFSDEKVPGYDNPLDILCTLMQKKLYYKPGEKDMLLMKHTFTVENKDKSRDTITSTLVDFGIPGGDTSMARTVSLPLAIGVRLMAEEKIPLAGIQIPTVKTIYEPVLNALEQLNIKMEEKRFKSR